MLGERDVGRDAAPGGDLGDAGQHERRDRRPGRRARIGKRLLDDRVELEVGNTGAVASRPSTGGLGQIGMRERVAASGGTLEAGPRSRGGYLVRAVVPLSPSAAGHPVPERLS